MTQAELLSEVVETFRYVPRPSLSEIRFHKDECAHCEMTAKFLAGYTEPALPASAIRWLCDELSSLSAEATRWLLPSYLRHVLTDPIEMERPIEFLIYNISLSPSDELQKRLSGLNDRQVECLRAVIDFWCRDEHWGDYCSEELERARTVLARTR
jgi:hypothetical protein